MALAPSSPRLPSPPPPAEIQIGPKSPSGGPPASLTTTELEQSLLDANSKRRIHPGTKAEDIAAGPPLVPLNELDSAFQLQEHLAALHNHLSSSGTKPIDRDTAYQLAKPPAGIDRTLWLYELCRFLISQCNSLIVGFLFDAPPCSAATCPEMRASEWQFLCAVHEQPKSCCAIDYCCHTLDWAANVVTDQKLFPSRFVVLGDAHSKNVGVKNLVNVFRRLHRIFAHAWFQHRSVFWSVEGQTGLYVFFKTVCDLFDLLPAENYKLPPEAEGLEAPSQEPDPDRPVPAILKPQSQQRANGSPEDDSSHPGVSRTNTRRHVRNAPSVGSAVDPVAESAEEEPDSIARKVKELKISAPEPVAEEPETADVPMIVEGENISSDSAPEAPPETKSEEKGEEKGEEKAEAEDADADQTVVEDPPAEEPKTEEAEVAAEVEEPAKPEAAEPAKEPTEAEAEPTEPTAETNEDTKATDEKGEAEAEAKPEEK